MKQIRTLILEASAHLNEQGVGEPEREARSLMAFALQKDQSFLRGHPEYSLDSAEHELFVQSVNRRGRREPFQHIVGKQEFYGLEFAVNSDVLVPRPETELVVETALEAFSGSDDLYFCDVGTGSGCIAISILAHVAGSVCVATDISEKALAIAEINAQNHGLEDRLFAMVSDVFKAIAEKPIFDLIVANPPYVPKKDFEGLQTEVREFDPKVALTDGRDGSSVIREIERCAFNRLKTPGLLVMEIGFNQSETVAGIFERGEWESFEFKSDLQGMPRVVCGRKSR